MFDRFTDAAKKTMSRSRQEALRLHDDCIDVRHILLGLLRQPCPDVATALTNVGVQPAQLLAAIEAVIPAGNGQPNSMGQMPFTVAGKQVLMKAMEAAAAMHHTWIGTEHLLLG
ncbi:MAG TPA: Clp protease N-terminal domain-containing protein, partial [Planctomycetota bacterium]|nr:Clp protease N-terminal domain-containing protein [Planctomycetota bacterium]